MAPYRRTTRRKRREIRDKPEENTKVLARQRAGSITTMSTSSKSIIESLQLLEQQQLRDLSVDLRSCLSSDWASTNDEFALHDEETQPETAGNKEATFLTRFRAVLVVVLLLTGSAICAGTFFFVNNEVSNDFKLSVSSVRPTGQHNTVNECRDVS